MLVRREKVCPEMFTMHKKPPRSLLWLCDSKRMYICYFYVIRSEKAGADKFQQSIHQKCNFQTNKIVTKFRSKSTNTFDPSTMKCSILEMDFTKRFKCYS